MGSLTRKTATVGVAESEDLGAVPDKTPLQLMAQATKRALDDAGLAKRDIDGLFCAGLGTTESLMMGEYLGIQPSYADTTNTGGSALDSTHSMPRQPFPRVCAIRLLYVTGPTSFQPGNMGSACKGAVRAAGTICIRGTSAPHASPLTWNGPR
jgi:hypothetical protein